jgi:hypothetical protein
MSKTLSLLCLVALLVVAAPMPAEAQLRSDANAERAQTRLYDSGAAHFLLNTLFSPDVFQMRHSYEMSVGSFGGNSYSMGAYTNTLAWQFNDKWAARADVSLAFSPFGGSGFGHNNGLENGRLFLRNAEIAYRPTDNMIFHVQVRQSPYGRYASPYGYYRPYGGSRYDMGAASADRLFWKDRGR